ncbi:MAG TPA: hypothetical protein VIB39_20740 [Candidatus Angelobacter sp.]
MLISSLPAATRSAPERLPGLHSAMPAGYDVITLQPSGLNLSLMGLIECPELEGAQHISEGLQAKIITAAGARMNEFPHHFSFRITASLRKIILDGPASSVIIPDDPYAFLLKLRFRIKAYHGLEVREVFADSVELIGMPGDVPYDERVYRVTVDIKDAPITDRFVVDILTPEGELLTHFPFTVL